MGFLAPWVLGGLALLGVPVFVHLLRRHVDIPRPVSSLMFFERGIQSSARHHRLKHLVLFALRSALVLLIVLAFANPYVHRSAAHANERLLLIVLDNSFSMRAGTRFADAKREALATLEAKPSSQRAEIMALGGVLQVLTQPVSDLSQSRSALLGIGPGDGRGNFGELGRGLRAMAETARMPVDVHIFSDMQQSAMPANFSDLILPGTMTLHLHSVASGAAPPNWTVESVAAPAELPDPKDTVHSRVHAVIAGFNTPAASKAVSLIVNGKTVAMRKVSVAANGRADVEFAPLEVSYGFNRCAVRVEGNDSFPADDANVFSVRRSDPERVLFVHSAQDGRSAVYFGAALNAAAKSSFVLQSIRQDETTDFDPSRFAFVVLSDAEQLPSRFEHALAQYVAKGGSVLIVLGTLATRHVQIPVWKSNVLDTRDYARAGNVVTVGKVDSTHPAFVNPKSDADSGVWADTRVFYAGVVDPQGARVIAQLSDGTPLVLEKQVGQGHLLLMTSGLDDLTNDLPLHPVFVAFVDHVARYLSGTERLSGAGLVDSYIQLRAPVAVNDAQAAAVQSGVQVIDPDGRRPLSLSDARVVHSLRLERAGFYRIRLANGQEAVIGVNPDRRESDLKPIDDDLLKLWSGNAGEPQSRTETTLSAENRTISVSLWWYVLLLAFAVTLAETAVASGYTGTRREEI